MPIKYLFFDCDNTLVKSERLAFEACAELTNEVLAKHNIDKRYTLESLLEDFVGYNFRRMLEALQQNLNFTMSPQEVDEYVGMEVGRVTAKLSEKAVPCDGVIAVLDQYKGKIPMAVVSTSAGPRVVASVIKAGMGNGKYWPDEHIYSAATSMPEPSSKPDPKIYHWAAEKVGCKEADIVTVEDSKSGATAAMRAGIPCIGYVGIYKEEEGQAKAEQMAKVLKEDCKCAEIMWEWSEYPTLLKKIDPSFSL